MIEVLRLSLPLSLWLAAFSAVYGLHGLVCALGIEGRLLLIAAAGLALALQVAALLVLRSRRFGSRSAFLRRTGIALGIAGVVASGWSLMPVLATSSCFSL